MSGDAVANASCDRLIERQIHYVNYLFDFARFQIDVD
jgi:hypothetical protein